MSSMMPSLLKSAFVMMVCALPLAAQFDPEALVKTAVANEIQASEHPQDFWMYRLDKVS